MAAKVHKSLRLDDSLVKRVEALRNDNEPLSNAMCRVMAVGCDTLENVARQEHVTNADAMAAHKAEHDENTKKIIALLETENARLVAEHEADRAAIAEKDDQIAAALAKAHDLAEQAHVLTGRAQEAGQLPNPADDGGEIVDVSPVPEKIGFWDWFRNYR